LGLCLLSLLQWIIFLLILSLL